MKAHLTRRYRFSASHRLHSEAMSEAENRSVYGKCNNPHGHGHNYALEVTVGGPVDPQSGMVCNLVDLDGFMRQRVLERYEFANLNDMEEFRSRVPSTEHLCMHIYELLAQDFRLAAVERVLIEETRNNSFEYAGGADLRH
jgi:6-pyruvoyltetrahydropterin/6-carboxytetrahydropterin synthase